MTQFVAQQFIRIHNALVYVSLAGNGSYYSVKTCFIFVVIFFSLGRFFPHLASLSRASISFAWCKWLQVCILNIN